MASQMDVSPHALDMGKIQQVLRANEVVLDKETVDLNINIKLHARKTK